MSHVKPATGGFACSLAAYCDEARIRGQRWPRPHPRVRHQPLLHRYRHGAPLARRPRQPRAPKAYPQRADAFRSSYCELSRCSSTHARACDQNRVVTNGDNPDLREAERRRRAPRWFLPSGLRIQRPAVCRSLPHRPHNCGGGRTVVPLRPSQPRHLALFCRKSNVSSGSGKDGRAGPASPWHRQLPVKRLEERIG